MGSVLFLIMTIILGIVFFIILHQILDITYFGCAGVVTSFFACYFAAYFVVSWAFSFISRYKWVFIIIGVIIILGYIGNKSSKSE